MAQKRKCNWKIDYPKLNAADFDMPGYTCVLVHLQKDNRLLGIYVSQSLEDYHTLVVIGEYHARCKNMQSARDYCKRMHYDIPWGS